MQTNAIILTAPGQLGLRATALTPPGAADVVVDVAWSGISTGTERLLYNGRMPPFPGMGYPLVPGYETVGRVRTAGPDAMVAPGTLVFVPGANCYGDVRGLFGGAASQIVTAGTRVVPVPESLGERATLMALAATAQHALALPGAGLPDLIVGHGTLGRLAGAADRGRGRCTDRVGACGRPQGYRRGLRHCRSGRGFASRLPHGGRRERRL